MSAEQLTIFNVCTKCSREFPATAAYFHFYRLNRNFGSWCIECRAKDREYYANNIERERATKRKSTQKHRKKIYEYQKTWRNKNREKVRASNNEQYIIHRTHIQKRSKAYRESNKEVYLAQVRAAWQLLYYSDIEKYREKGRLASLKRNTRKKELPHLWDKDIWHWCLEQWEYACAYCGKPSSVEIVLAMEHVIPLGDDDCPGTVPWNMIPACHGIGGCNVRKNARPVRQFLEEVFSSEAAAEKLCALETFFTLARRLYASQELLGGTACVLL